MQTPLSLSPSQRDPTLPTTFHRVVLAAASKVWNAKFARWSSSEAQKGELDHCETDSIVMEKLMDIIYTGKTQVENRAELLALAKEAECFNMQSVKTVMENELKEFVSKETCCELLMIARNSGLDQLDAACKEVLLREFEEVRKAIQHRRDHHPLHTCVMQVCQSEDFLQLGEEDVREMLRDDKVIPHCFHPLSSLAMCPRCAVCSERREACVGGGDTVDEGW